MLNFRNDYHTGCIDDILQFFQSINQTAFTGYGLDTLSEQAKQTLRSKMPDHDVDIHFVVGGTQANTIALKAFLRSYEAVISCDQGHIATHETGAIEATGHKVITIPNKNGKIVPEDIRLAFEQHMLTYEHMVYPKCVYISNATELGTIYTRQELEAIHAVCQELGLYLFMDGARLGVALMSGVDYTMNDLPLWCDAFTVGGTKNGALFGEAICIVNPNLREHFRFVIKQCGGMLAKGWLLGAQFEALFAKDAFYTNAKHAIDLARHLQEAIHELGYPLYMKSDSNLVFPVLTKEQFTQLSQEVDFEVWEKRDDTYVIRLVTCYATTKEEVEQLIVLLTRLRQTED